MTARILRGAVALATAAVFLSAPAWANGGADDVDLGGGNGGVDIIGDGEGSETGGGNGNEGGSVGPAEPQPWTEYRYVIFCSVNGPENPDDALCTGAVSGCPEQGQIRYRVYTREHNADGSLVDPDGPWEYQGIQCRGADDPPEGGPPTITIADVREVAREEAPIPTVGVEPGARTYVNLPTNFYANDDAVTVTTAVLGTAVTLTFTPTSYSWAYGDGGVGTGAGVQGADVGAPGAVEYAYRRSGSTNITLTRTYSVQYVVAGGDTGTLPAPEISNTSAPYPLTIGEIQSVVKGVR